MDYQIFFEKANEKHITNIQITEKQTINSSVELINGKMESFENYNNIDYAIKAEYNSKTVKTSTNYLGEDILDLLILKAEETDSNYADDYIDNKNIIERKPAINFEISEEIKKLKELDKLRIKYPNIKKLTTFFGESYTNTRIINSKGVDISTDSHLCSFLAEAIVEKKGECTSFDKKVLNTDKKKIDFESIIEDVMKKTVLQSQKEKIETKKYDILLDSNVSSRIIAHLTNMLSATNIRNQVSCLEKELNQSVFSDKLTIVEDPTNRELPGYRLFDDEGTETTKKTIIDKGIIKTFLYNIKEAKIKNNKSTGNGYQGIGVKNMYVVPGNNSFEELLKKLDYGIYITDYMGASGTSINTVNGQISIQIFGFLVKDGKLISGIEPSIMTTTIFELLNNIEEIDNKIEFTNTSTASPALLIKDISIAR